LDGVTELTFLIDNDTNGGLEDLMQSLD